MQKLFGGNTMSQRRSDPKRKEFLWKSQEGERLSDSTSGHCARFNSSRGEDFD